MCMNIRGRQKKVLDPAPRIGVTGSCEWLDLGAGNCTPVFCKSSRTSYYVIFPVSITILKVSSAFLSRIPTTHLP